MSEDTVSFDIGGRIFRVRRSLLESYPTTIMARSASEEWHKKGIDQPAEAEPKPIFIDRDSDRLRYCLDYMRDGKVQLPHTESRAALLKDLEYYGFEDVDPSSISVDFPAFEAAECLISFDKETKSNIDNREIELQHMKLARDCFDQYRKTTLLHISIHCSEQESYKFSPNRKFKADLFNDCLKQYGLRYAGNAPNVGTHIALEPLSPKSTDTDE